ncbi:MAG: GNAT family N-acetyltransferase [Planococcus donghaensis]
MLKFTTINPEKQSERVIEFRKDSFKVSFGDAVDFDEIEYLHWLKEKTTDYPDGFVVIEEDGKLIGQLELSIREYEGKRIGYVNLYYLVPESRGKGRGKELHAYAKEFFKNRRVKEFHLRVAPTNTPAIKFYHKLGMEELGPEVNGKVIRMKGSI